MGLDEIDREDVLLVCGGIDVQKSSTRGVLNWLRREARRGVTIGGLCTGAHALAKAGLLVGKRATCFPGFEGQLTGATLATEAVVDDGDVITSRGPGTAMPFALALVARLQGAEKAKKLAAALLWSA